MTGREAIGPAVLAIGVALIVLAFAKMAGATEYEIWASRPGAELRTDQPNTYRIREKDEEPFASLTDCREALKGYRIDKLIGFQGGWRLRCQPVPVPFSRVVTR